MPEKCTVIALSAQMAGKILLPFAVRHAASL